MKAILHKIHEFVTGKMANSRFVENVLIAKYTDGGVQHDCIYCTIIRVGILFWVLGVLTGLVLGAVWQLI